jgi:hypothetical protein
VVLRGTSARKRRGLGLNSYERALLAGVALVIAVALVRSAEDPTERREPAADASRAARPLSESQIARIARRVERLRDLRFKTPVRPLFLSRSGATRLIQALTRDEYPSRDRLIDEEELKLLGLLEPSDDLRRVIEAVASEEILGFYDDRSKRLVVIREQAGTRAVAEITLAHELVHALEDQHFTFRARRGLSDDAALAESALAEGTATQVMIEYAERHLESGALLDLALGGLAGSDTKLPPYVEESLLFPYEQGQKFVAAFRDPRGGWRALDKILRLRHPRSAEQVLHPEKYAADERPAGLAKADLDAVLGEAWRRVDSTSVGELDLRSLYEIVGGSPAPSAAAGWNGGRFDLWRRKPVDGGPCRSPCIERDVGVMRLSWDAAGDRAEAEDRLPRVFERGLEGRRVSAKRGPGLWHSRGGAIGMSGRGRRTTIVLAPDARLAARLLLSIGP